MRLLPCTACCVLAFSCSPRAKEAAAPTSPTTYRQACTVGEDELDDPAGLQAMAKRDACVAHTLPKSAPRSLKALRVYVELTSPRVPLGENVTGVVWYQNDEAPPLEVWLDLAHPLEQAIRIVPDETATESAPDPEFIVSKPEPCDPHASPVTLLRFVLPGGSRIHQPIEWKTTANGQYRIDVRPKFATCVVDPTGATLVSKSFGVPGHP